jgi:hypothetical protein
LKYSQLRGIFYSSLFGIENNTMSLFAIMAPADSVILIDALKTHYPDNHLKVGPGQWLVAGFGTAVDVSNKLGISGGTMGVALVCLIGGYYGLASNNIWEWMATKGSIKAIPNTIPNA